MTIHITIESTDTPTSNLVERTIILLMSRNIGQKLSEAIPTLHKSEHLLISPNKKEKEIERMDEAGPHYGFHACY